MCSVPGLNEWLERTIHEQLKPRLLWPQHIAIRLGGGAIESPHQGMCAFLGKFYHFTVYELEYALHTLNAHCLMLNSCAFIVCIHILAFTLTFLFLFCLYVFLGLTANDPISKLAVVFASERQVC